MYMNKEETMKDNVFFETARKSLFVSIHILSILAGSVFFIDFLNLVFNFEIPFPDFLVGAFFILIELIAVPFIAIIMFILVPSKINRVLCVLYFAVWIFAIYKIFFCNC